MVDKQTEVIIYLDKFPIYVSIENNEKYSATYMSLCILRNKLIENGFVKKDFRDNMYFYKKINNSSIKIKEEELLECTIGPIYLYIKKEKDFSESSNILFYLEKRISEFEPVFKKLYKEFVFEYESNSKEKYQKYQNIINLWNDFKEYNDESFEYNNWYFIMKQDDLSLIRKMSLDIKKWIRQKEKTMAQIDLIYLNELEYKVNEEDFNFINSYINYTRISG